MSEPSSLRGDILAVVMGSIINEWYRLEEAMGAIIIEGGRVWIHGIHYH